MLKKLKSQPILRIFKKIRVKLMNVMKILNILFH